MTQPKKNVKLKLLLIIIILSSLLIIGGIDLYFLLKGKNNPSDASGGSESLTSDVVTDLPMGIYCYVLGNEGHWTKKFQSKMKHKRPKINFITYGNSVFENSKQRLLREAKEFGEFDTIRGFGPDDIKRETHSDEFNKILDMPRGGGYWLWRHDIINDTLETMNDNDFLIYLDAGSTLNIQGKKRFYEYLQLLHESKKGILSFQMKHKEKYWTTKEIFDFFGESLDGEIANSGQIINTVLIMQKNSSLLQYMKSYSEIVNNHPLLATDTFNEKQTHEGFQDNRHEQSITSILRKKMNLQVINDDESWKPPFGKGDSLKYPFWATRIRN